MCHVAVWPSVNDRLALLLVTWKKSKVAKHLVEFAGQSVAFVAGSVRLETAGRRHGTARLCKPETACLSFSTPDTILFVRRQLDLEGL